MRKTYMTSHVIEFLETLVHDNSATQNEKELYEDYKLFGTVNKDSGTYKLIVYKYLKSNY
ncbi:hypothetical protein [Bacillus atrophaeus]|uniref:hypothetical protein n=1 Tax=Bacillus atrophaeus TaxID=1452 RepID=UPI003D214D02